MHKNEKGRQLGQGWVFTGSPCGAGRTAVANDEAGTSMLGSAVGKPCGRGNRPVSSARHEARPGSANKRPRSLSSSVSKSFAASPAPSTPRSCGGFSFAVGLHALKPALPFEVKFKSCSPRCRPERIFLFSSSRRLILLSSRSLVGPWLTFTRARHATILPVRLLSCSQYAIELGKRQRQKAGAPCGTANG